MKSQTLIGLAIVALLAVIAISTLSANGAFKQDPGVITQWGRLSVEQWAACNAERYQRSAAGAWRHTPCLSSEPHELRLPALHAWRGRPTVRPTKQRHDNTRQPSNNDAYIKRVMTLFVAGWFLIGAIGATISSLT